MAALEFKEVMTHTISKLLIPLLPLYINVSSMNKIQFHT